MSTIYVTGHRSPDADAIASALGYAQLKGRLDPDNRYVAARLGPCNPQTTWLLRRSGADPPEFLPHIMLRVCDVMQRAYPVSDRDTPLREAGRYMVDARLELVPVVDDKEALIGVVTERTLARRYIRESRETSILEAPTFVDAVVQVLDGELIAGENRQLKGRVWVHSMDVSSPSGIAPGDIVVTGNRGDSQRLAIDRGAGLLVISNGARPDAEVVDLASAHTTAIIVSPLDTYVSARMISLAAPCHAFMEEDPLTAAVDYLVADVAEQIKDIHYGAAVVVDSSRKPVGLLTRSDLVAPRRRRVILVDHAEQAQSVAGIEQAEIVEILDHHHVGSIETRVPVMATFDPVGSTSTLVVERFRQSGMEPSPDIATMLLGAILSDTVILNSVTTTERDRDVVSYLERVLAIDAGDLGRELFESTADVSEVPAEEIISRDAKDYQVGSGQTICIAQVEVVGKGLLDRSAELLDAMGQAREQRGLAIFALMITDVLSKGTDLLVAGNMASVARTFAADPQDGRIELPGVMSRKRQVAPKLLAAL
ncbi:MAG: putative manganese-dependent inorganic diphosphatase [Solirubrobacteraceae bacterium]